jgi:phage shock protein PspC (stress-responsive transcriptional regulator)
MEKKLFRNEHDRVIAGVASGLADYLNMDKTIVRLLFVLSTLFLAGSGIAVYIILWIVAPVKNDTNAKFQQFNDFFNAQGSANTDPNKWNTPNSWGTGNANFARPKKNNDLVRSILGTIFLVLGAYFLLREFGLIPFWIKISYIFRLWPLAIIALGIMLIFRRKQKTEWEQFNASQQNAASDTNETTAEEVKENN